MTDQDPKNAPLDPALALETRERLPDALRVLLEKHPREGWARSGKLGPLAAFWLEKHLGFRRLLARLTAEAEGFLDGKNDPRAFAMAVSRLGGGFAQELHGHHMIEDHHYFPALKARESRLARGFEILDADHHALDAHLQRFVEDSNAALQAFQNGALGANEAGAYLATLRRFEPFLDRHLVAEEEIVAPILLEHGEEWLR